MTRDHSSIKRLANRYAGHEVTIYCNLRRPDEYLSSWHRQRLKFGAKLERRSENGLQEYIDSVHVQQGRMIESWLLYFPDARLVMRNFDAVKAAGGSVHDFIAHSGLAFPSQLPVPKDQNPSVPSAFAEIGRRAQHELPRELADAGIHWLTRAGDRVDHPQDRGVEMFGPANRRVLMDAFRPVSGHLDRLAGSPFYDNLEAFGQQAPLSDVDAARQALPALVTDAGQQELSERTQDWLKSLVL